MSSKKKKPPLRPKPLTLYERTLEDAKKRLAKAVDERTAALMKLDKLAGEIPYLETLVIALTPPRPEVIAVSDLNARLHAGFTGTDPLPAPPPPVLTPPPVGPVGAPVEMDQAQFLARFMPRPGRTTTIAPPPPRQAPDGTSEDPDEFLTGEAGNEILS